MCFDGVGHTSTLEGRFVTDWSSPLVILLTCIISPPLIFLLLLLYILIERIKTRWNGDVY